MDITRTTVKGQVLIPVAIRRKYRLKKGSRLAVIDRQGEIVLKPLHDDPIKKGLGFLPKGSNVLEVLLQERKKEAKL